MNNKWYLELLAKVEQLTDLSEKIQNTSIEIETSPEIMSAILKSKEILAEYKRKQNAGNLAELFPLAEKASYNSELIGQLIQNYHWEQDELYEYGNSIREASQDLRGALHNLGYKMNQLENNDNSKTTSTEDYLNLIIRHKEQYKKHEQTLSNFTKEARSYLNKLQDKCTTLEHQILTEISKVQKLYNEATREVEEKKDQINKILGHASGRAIAGDYENSAAAEKKMADWLRGGSIACMLAIAVIVGISFWDTTTQNFNWQNSIFRILFTFLLSVPAAYLARESTKHRLQQYEYLQTSLDLKAITPYIASLPEEAQHKIKLEIANRLFASKDFSKLGSDPYPINTHEILMELIKRIDIVKPNSSQSRNEKKEEGTTTG